MNKIYYGNSINLSGLYSKQPIKCCDPANYNDYEYWDESGDFSININKLGLWEKDGLITYSSENENDVLLWTQGVISTMRMLKKWSR